MPQHLQFPVKDPAEQLDYEVLLTDWLAPGDTVANATVTTSAVELVVAGVLTNPNSIRFWLTGGLAGRAYTVACTATTAEGRIIRRTVSLPVAAR